jgi:hypothetical protein
MNVGHEARSPCRRDEMAHLVDEDQRDEADAEAPAPEERVAADRDEDRGELEPDEAELRQEEDGRDHGAEQLLQEVAEGGEPAARLDRLVVAVLRVLLHRPTVAVRPRSDTFG